MKNLLLALIILYPIVSLAQKTQEKEVLSIASSLFPGLLSKQGKNPIKTQGCNFQKERWAMLLLTGESFKENIKFNKQCDIQGTFTVKRDQYFPVNFKIRNLKNYKSIKAHIKLNIEFEIQTLLVTRIKDAKLLGKTPLVFGLEYKVAIDPMDPKNFVKKRLGGHLLIKRGGKLEKFKIK
jgi:hypothetical protein